MCYLKSKGGNMGKFLKLFILIFMATIMLSHFLIYNELKRLKTEKVLIERLSADLFITNEHIRDLNKIFKGIELGNRAHNLKK